MVAYHVTWVLCLSSDFYDDSFNLRLPSLVACHRGQCVECHQLFLQTHSLPFCIYSEPDKAHSMNYMSMLHHLLASAWI